MDKSILKISKPFLFFVFLSLPFYSSTFINQNPYLDKIFNGWKLLVFFVILFYLPKIEITFPTVLVAIIQVFLVIVTLYRGAAVKRALTTAFPIICMMLIYELGKYNLKEFIRAQYYIFSAIIYLNFLCEIVYPKGMFISDITRYWQNWLLGYYNNHSIYYIPATSIALLYQKIYGRKISVYILMMTIAFSAILINSGGVTATLIAMFLYWLFLKRLRIVNYFTTWMIHIVFFLVIVVLRASNVVFFLTQKSEEYFRKGHSFYARYQLWIKAMKHISNMPIIGHGIESQLARLHEYGWGLHAHNFLLEVLHQGGVTYAGLLALLIILCGIYLEKCNDTYVISAIVCGFFGWVIATLVEPFMVTLLTPMFFLAYNANRITEIIQE